MKLWLKIGLILPLLFSIFSEIMVEIKHFGSCTSFGFGGMPWSPCPIGDMIINRVISFVGLLIIPGIFLFVIGVIIGLIIQKVRK